MSFTYKTGVDISAKYSGRPEVRKAVGDLSDLKDTTVKLSNGLGFATSALKGFAGLFAVGQVTNYAKSIIDLGDNLRDMSQKTGIGVNALSSLKTAAELGGVSFEELQGSLKKFTVNVGLASGGSEKASRGFSALGISIKDASGKTKGSDTLLTEIADRFSKMKDGAGKAALAVSLFGKTGVNLIPVLNEGGDSLSKFGIKFGKDFTDNADGFNDSITVASDAVITLSQEAIGPLLPILTDLVEGFTELLKPTSEASPLLEKLGDGLKNIAVVGVGAFTILGNGADAVFTGFQGLTRIIRFIGQEIRDLSEISSVAMKALTGDISGAVKGLDEIAKKNKRNLNTLSESYTKDVSAFTKRVDQRNQNGVDAIREINPGSLFGEKVGKQNNRVPSLNAPNVKSELSAQEIEDIRQKESIQSFIASQNSSFEVQKRNTEEVGKSRFELERLNDITKINAEVSRYARTMTDENANAMRRAGEAAIDNVNKLAELREAQRTSFGAGSQQFFRDYVETASSTANQVYQVFQGAFRGLEDSIMTFVKTGKLSFQDLANTVSDMLMRIAIQRTIAFGLNAAFGGIGGVGATAASSAGNYSLGVNTSFGEIPQFANGGIMTSMGSVPLRKYSRGGVATSPQMAVFGEGSRPEAYVPLPDGRSIPVAIRGSSTQSGDSSVVVNVSVASNGQANESSESNTQRGKELGQTISAIVQAEIIKQKRAGGLLA